LEHQNLGQKIGLERGGGGGIGCPCGMFLLGKKKIEGYIALLSLDSVIYFYNHFIPL
jgi:hypothetical protein